MAWRQSMASRQRKGIPSITRLYCCSCCNDKRQTFRSTPLSRRCKPLQDFKTGNRLMAERHAYRGLSRQRNCRMYEMVAAKRFRNHFALRRCRIDWLLNDNQKFMNYRTVGIRIPNDEGFYENEMPNKKMAYVFYLKRDPLMKDLFNKLTVY